MRRFDISFKFPNDAVAIYNVHEGLISEWRSKVVSGTFFYVQDDKVETLINPAMLTCVVVKPHRPF